MSDIDPRKNMAQLIRDVPELGRVLKEMGIDCGGCLASQVDTLQDVVRMYHVDLEQLLAKVRSATSKQKSS
ncbi:MAG: DUF1858 domain-containing protein [Magnetococcales bacterium]|nr:DUF1858 domain-containing protein [Magnetococcales bacterium]NGZ25552.1 DUF1858 domain-containing protein [Magnetococcales bacterium]